MYIDIVDPLPKSYAPKKRVRKRIDQLIAQCVTVCNVYSLDIEDYVILTYPGCQMNLNSGDSKNFEYGQHQLHYMLFSLCNRQKFAPYFFLQSFFFSSSYKLFFEKDDVFLLPLNYCNLTLIGSVASG